VGNSALGISQILNAAAGGNIDCQLVHVAPCEFYGYVSYMGGVFLKNLVEGWTTSTGIAHTIDLYKAHPTRDSFWSYYDARSRASQVTAPGLHLGGWFDVFQQGTIDNFTTRQHDGGQGARGNQKLVIGPWGHNRSSTIGELTFPRSALPTLQPIQEMFIEHWLEGTENGVMNEAPVNYYTMGAVDEAGAPGNEWHAAGDWPPFPTVQRAYRAAAGNVLSSEAAAQDDDALTFTFDPSNPCPTRGGQNLMMAAGPMDQRPVSTRADVLRFATQPLPRPVELTGRVHARLYVSTDAPDTDFTAKFVDIYPDGREMLMLDGIQRVKFRDSDVTPSPLPIGQIGVLEVDLWSISLIVNAGHRIGMQVSSSNYPRFEVNPNNGDDFPGAHPLRVAHNTLHTGAQYPSALYLPLRDSDGDALPDYDEAAFGSDPLRRRRSERLPGSRLRRKRGRVQPLQPLHQPHGHGPEPYFRRYGRRRHRRRRGGIRRRESHRSGRDRRHARFGSCGDPRADPVPRPRRAGGPAAKERRIGAVVLRAGAARTRIKVEPVPRPHTTHSDSGSDQGHHP
jgi:putative CocE/NonD family hydrolase